MQTQEIQDIILAKISGEKLSAKDTKAFETWYSNPENRRHFNSLLNVKSGLLQSAAPDEKRTTEVWEKIRSSPRKRSILFRLSRYAAVILVLIMGGSLFVYLNDSWEDAPAVEPGRRIAYLVTSDGSELDLTTIQTFTDKGTRITNSIDEGLAYGDVDDGKVPAFHKIVIPRGGEYQLTLADGTRVWLNAESRLRYPTAFDGDERIVELEGEAYFKVKGDPERPFIVATSDYEIRVTGTEFNIRSYGAGQTATTLVEGSVSIVKEGVVTELRPGQQAGVTINDGIVVREVDTYAYTAWQNGEFSFSSTRLSDIMEQLMRWYDMEVVYADEDVKAFRFFGWFSRKTDIGVILSVLEQTNKVRFELKGDKLTVYKR